MILQCCAKGKRGCSALSAHADLSRDGLQGAVLSLGQLMLGDDSFWTHAEF